MNLRKSFFVLIILMPFFSCSEEKVQKLIGQLEKTIVYEEEHLTQSDFYLYPVGNLYSIRTPHYFEMSNFVNMQTSLQMKSVNNDAFLMIFKDASFDFFKDTKENYIFNDSLSSVENYKNVAFPSLLKSLNNIEIVSERKSHTERADFIYIELVGNIQVDGEKVDFGYSIAFIQGKDHFYTIYYWTSKRLLVKYRDSFAKSISSFKEK